MGELFLRNANLYAYTLLPNQIHILFQVNDRGARLSSNMKPRYRGIRNPEDFHIMQLISKDLGKMFSSFTQAVNRCVGRRGSLFRGSRKVQSLIHDEDGQVDLAELFRYKKMIEIEGQNIGFENENRLNPFQSNFQSEWNNNYVSTIDVRI